MKKILAFLMSLGLVALLVGIGFAAFFSDTETSSSNTFSAGTLDLQVDGESPLASAKFDVSNFRPGAQSKGTFHLDNAGTIDGYLDLEGISVVNAENGCIEPELEAGDSSCGDPGDGKGELQDVVNLRLSVNGCDGSGGKVFYDGLVSGLPDHFDLNEPINSNSSLCITAQFDWCNNCSGDNLAQSDSMALEVSFELGQDKEQ
jgi:predicted ribosomally synthesized peptide with SipW-like signal peptide